MSDIAIVGGGNMGEALIKGLRTSYRITVCEASAERAAQLKKSYKITVADIHTALKSKIVILAVKPQDMDTLLQGAQARQGQLFISIAAGLTTSFFEKRLGPYAKVVRCMPNMPALIGQGITALCGGRQVKPADLKTAQKVLASVGKTIAVRESQMDAVTAVSGSGPAYVFYFVECWLQAAQDLGLAPDFARALVYQTLTGSAHLLEGSELDAATLRAKVTSKGGTTQAAFDILLKSKLEQFLKRALCSAQKRAQTLSR